jgi:hypothetical protein
MFYDGSSSKILTPNPDAVNYRDLHIDIVSHSSTEVSLPAFGTRFAISGYAINNDSPQMQINNSNVTGAWGNGSTGGSSGISPVTTLGNNKFEFGGTSSGNINFDGMFIATPIHTSSHYQTFETPYLHELVGGDRNMEQTNLVVTPDGKTWDEVTRDVSYISNICINFIKADADISSPTTIIWDECRGKLVNRNLGNKDFAIAYDRIICLKEGWYRQDHHQLAHTAGTAGYTDFSINGSAYGTVECGAGATRKGNLSATWYLFLKRGDYIQQSTSTMRGHEVYNGFQISRIK